MGKISKFELPDSDVCFSFVKNKEGLKVTLNDSVRSNWGLLINCLYKGAVYYVLSITRYGLMTMTQMPKAPGSLRIYNLEYGDFNNDLVTRDKHSDVWSCSFTGSSVTIIAPKEQGAGKIEVQNDGQKQTTADLSTNGSRLPLQTVNTITNLTPGDHTISIINRGVELVSIDTIVVQ